MRSHLFLFLFLGCATLASAQQRGNGRNDRPNNAGLLQNRMSTLSGGLEIGIPVAAFGDSWGREIVGLSANVAMPMRLLPFDLGFDVAWGRMGGESKVVAVNEAVLAVNTGDLEVNSNVYGYHALARFKPFNGKVSPYVEGLVGLRHFTTRSILRVDGLDEPFSKERNASSFAGSAGWAVGLQFAPTRAFYVEGRVERLNSGKVAYVDPDSIVIDANGVVSYETRSTSNNVVNVHLGIGLRF